MCWLTRPTLAHAADDTSSLGLLVFGAGLPPETLRNALAGHLGRPVVLLPARPEEVQPYLTVSWKESAGELAVSYDEPQRGTVSRVIPSRPGIAAVVEDAVSLATSLVAREADELLGAPKQAPAAPPTPTVPAPERPLPEVRSLAIAAPLPAARAEFVPAYASLFHPLATNVEHPYATTRFGFNLLFGRAGELANGVQLGWINAIVGKEGLSTGNMSGVQLAPAFGVNYVSGNATGLQLGMVGNAAWGEMKGAQMALLANVAGGAAEGVQVAVLTNVAPLAMSGLQIGAVNVAGDVRGLQLGVINVAQHVEGSTIGIVNVADDISGVPIGLISVTRTGGVHPTAWASTGSVLNAGVQFATKHTYTMLSMHGTRVVGADYGRTNERPPLHLDSRDFVGGGFFVGGEVPFEHAFVDVDVGFSASVATQTSAFVDDGGDPRTYHEILLDPRIRVLVGHAFAPHFGLFVGGALLTRIRVVHFAEEAVVRELPELFGGVRF